MRREQLLAGAVLELADDVGALDLLHSLASRTAQLLGATAVGVVLADQRGDLQLVACSSHDPRIVELATLSSRAGPCRDAFLSGRRMIDVVGEQARARWPVFVAAARDAGVRGAHALPLRARRDRLGALGLFFDGPGVLPDEDCRIGEALAGVAVAGLLQERSSRQRELVAEQLQAVLTLQVVLEQAKGIIAAYLGCPVDEAFDRITGHARRTGTTLTAVASGVVDRSIAWEDLRGRMS